MSQKKKNALESCAEQLRRRYHSVILVDFEFSAPDGENPKVVCMVARDILSDSIWKMSADELYRRAAAPFPVGPDSLFIAFYASAEVGCFLSLSWSLPRNILDLYAEFRCLTNGKYLESGRGILGALIYYGEPSISGADKAGMRELAMTGGPFTEEQKAELLVYCDTDITAMEHLLPHIFPKISNLEHALLRGEYMRAAAVIEHNGIPIDGVTHRQLVACWDSMKQSLVQEIDPDGVFFERTTFKLDRFEKFLLKRNIAWPRTPTGRLETKDDTFKDMARLYPELGPILQLRSEHSGLRATNLAIGSDGRNRTLLSAFSSKTGRNQPSTNKFIFGLSAWARSLIKPTEGMALAYIDWSQQEFAIAACLSNDGNMIRAYESGDPYLQFAKQAGAAPMDATKESHGVIRDLYKACVLAVGYGMQKDSLAYRIGQSSSHADMLLQKHRRVYPQYWRWSSAVEDAAFQKLRIETVFGWWLHIGPDSRATSVRNFPIQGNGAEMLRLACCFAIDAGVKVCAPVHDALLIEAPIAELNDAVKITQSAMQCASETVLDGFALRTDVEKIVAPDRYCDKRGIAMWNRLQELRRRLSV